MRHLVSIAAAAALASSLVVAGGGGNPVGGGDVPAREPTPGIVTNGPTAAPNLLVVSRDSNGEAIDSEVTDQDGLFVVDVEEGGSLDVVGTAVVGAPVDPGNPVVVALP